MPPSTKNRRPVIVYLEDEAYRDVHSRARTQDRSASKVASRLIQKGRHVTADEEGAIVTIRVEDDG